MACGEEYCNCGIGIALWRGPCVFGANDRSVLDVAVPGLAISASILRPRGRFLQNRAGSLSASSTRTGSDGLAGPELTSPTTYVRSSMLTSNHAMTGRNINTSVICWARECGVNPDYCILIPEQPLNPPGDYYQKSLYNSDDQPTSSQRATHERPKPGKSFLILLCENSFFLPQANNSEHIRPLSLAISPLYGRSRETNVFQWSLPTKLM
jgi:hypothetical protein